MNREEMKGLADALEVQLHSQSPLFLTSKTVNEIIAALRASAAPETIECPNCHDANKCGDYEGPTCEVCMGEGRIAALSPDSRKAEPVAWSQRPSVFPEGPTPSYTHVSRVKTGPYPFPLYAALAPATEEGTVSQPSADRKAGA